MLPAPESAAQKQYLGLPADSRTFSLEEIEAQILIVKIFDIYCHVCQKAAPGANALYELIREKGYGGRIKMIGLAVGNTPFEAETFRMNFSTPFPIFPDRDKLAAKGVGYERVPEFVCLQRSADGRRVDVFRHSSYFTDAGTILDRILKRATPME